MNRNAIKELDERIIELAKKAKLDSWNSFVEELKIPSEVYPAIVTMRPELIRIAQRRALSAEEADALYNLIAGLIETNTALRGHAENVAALAQDFTSSMNGVITTAVKLKRFAQFRHGELEEEELELER